MLRVIGLALAVILGIEVIVIVLRIVLAWMLARYVLGRRDPDETCTPDAFGLAYEAVYFTSEDDVNLVGWHTRGDGDNRPTIIFCAGMFGSMDGDTRMVPGFIEAGFDVLQFDWRAHGLSGGRSSSPGMYEISDVLGAISFLHDRGIEKIGLMGFSFGGAVALRTAVYDERVRCVAADGAYVSIEHAMSGAFKEKIGLRLRYFSRLVLQMIELRLGGVDLTVTNPVLTVGKINPRPVLFIHGGGDLLVPEADQDALYDACGEPKEMWRVEGAGHREVYDMHAEEYMERVVGFFRGEL